MDKIFDVIFSPRIFFKTARFNPTGTLIPILILWFTNVLILFPTLKSIPFFSGYLMFSVILLGIFLLYCAFATALHIIVGKSGRVIGLSFPYVLMPHIMSGWIFSMSLFYRWATILFLIPITWSVILEFYLVRSSMGHGMLYTVIVRTTRDVIFFMCLYAFFRGWVV